MRSLAIGQGWQKRGGAVHCLSHSESTNMVQRVESAGIPLTLIPRPHPNPLDLETTLSRLDTLSASTPLSPWLLLDGYHFDSAYQQAVRSRGHRLLILDDMAHLPHYSAQVLLNQNIRAHTLSYSCNPDTVLLLGTRYAVLRPEFAAWQGWQRRVPGQARKVLITLGDGDSENITLRVINALDHIMVDGLETCAVIGANNPHRDSLETAAGVARTPIRLIRNTSNMAELMAWADVAVAAGGSTCWELAYMGLPCALVIVAENQRGNVEGLHEAGVAVNLGWFGHVTSADIAAQVTTLCQDQDLRARMSDRARGLVDGYGLDRLISVMTCP